MLRFLTSGESHGRCLTAIMDGVPSGLTLDIERVNAELASRQQGYGRGARQKIESDTAEFTGGIRHGITSGAPIGITITNRDWDNWQHVMSVDAIDVNQAEVRDQIDKKAIRRFRPGHADLAGTLKFRQRDIRDVLERASARETAARVAIGAVCRQLLDAVGINSVAHVIAVGNVLSTVHGLLPDLDLKELERRTLKSEMFCADEDAGERMKSTVKAAWQEGDSLGGIVEVICEGVPVGLGSYTQWDQKLDAQLAQALMSIQAIKAVEVGAGVTNASKPGSEVHDAIYPAATSGVLPFSRRTNLAGGIEGGMSNGSPIVIRAYMKPIPTLRKGLPSLSFPEYQAETAHYERSDVCAVPAASVVARAMVAFIIARALLDKFGGDTMQDLKTAVKNFRHYCAQSGTSNREGCNSGGLAPDMELE